LLLQRTEKEGPGKKTSKSNGKILTGELYTPSGSEKKKKMSKLAHYCLFLAKYDRGCALSASLVSHEKGKGGGWNTAPFGPALPRPHLFDKAPEH